MNGLTRQGSGGLEHVSGERHVDDGGWKRQETSFTDLNVQPPREIGVEVASGVAPPGRARRSPAGDVYHFRIGWKAGRGGILVVEQRQHLTARTDGRYQPDGPWNLRSSTFHPAQEARRRTADLPVSARSQNAHSPTVDRSISILEFLPQAAHRGLHAVQQPIHDSAAMVRSPSASGPGEHNYVISALRMNTTHAAVVHAVRRSETPTWAVTEVTYTLASANPLITDGQPRALQPKASAPPRPRLTR